MRVEKLSRSTVGGDYLAAIEDVRRNHKLYGKNSDFLYKMDIGVLYHYAGLYDSSTSWLLKADEVINGLFAHSVTNEAAAVMVNDNVRPYRSRPYELVMLHQFLASNFAATGNIDGALVETRRVQLMFDEWNRKNTKGQKYDSDGMFHYLSSILYDASGETSSSMISLFHAIRSFQAGPVPLESSLRDRAYYMFRINDRDNDNSLLSLSPGEPQESIEGLSNGATEIVLIGYAGRGPVIEEESYWGTWVKDGLLVLNHTGADGSIQTLTLPAPALPPEELRKAGNGSSTESGTTFHVKFALPSVRVVSSVTRDFTVTCSGRSGACTSIVINDLDKQAIKNLEDTRASTIARTVVRVVLRTIAAQAAKDRVQTSSPAANLLLNIGTDILADQLEKADTRHCFLLPKTVQIARVAVEPGSHTVTVAARSQNGSEISSKAFTDITVGPGEKKFLIYPSFK